jgi:predicted HicB family RNase H-like nuclease
MKDTLMYKGYFAIVHFSEEDNVFYGKLEGINDLVSFEGETVTELRKDFQDSVDDYLELCRRNGKTPEKPFKGSFNVRIGADLHRKAALTATERGISLNALVESAIRQAVGL